MNLDMVLDIIVQQKVRKWDMASGKYLRIFVELPQHIRLRRLVSSPPG